MLSECNPKTPSPQPVVPLRRRVTFSADVIGPSTSSSEPLIFDCELDASPRNPPEGSRSSCCLLGDFVVLPPSRLFRRRPTMQQTLSWTKVCRPPPFRPWLRAHSIRGTLPCGMLTPVLACTGKPALPADGTLGDVCEKVLSRPLPRAPAGHGRAPRKVYWGKCHSAKGRVRR